MRTMIAAVAVGVLLAAAGCSKPTQDKTSQDLKAVGSEVKDAAQNIAGSPAGKELGSDIKQGAQEAAAKTKQAADQAGQKLKEGADKAGSDIKSGADRAGAKADHAVNDAKDKTSK